MIYFEPGAELVIKSPGSITIRESTLQGCTHMWKGVTVIGQGSNNFLWMFDNTISDAYAGVEIKDDAHVSFGNIIFDRNYIGIYSEPTLNLKSFHGQSVLGCTFMSDGIMLPPYIGQPDWSEQTFAGVFVNDIDFFNIEHFEIPFFPISIDNKFIGITNGILAKNTSLTSVGNIFTDIADVNQSGSTSNLIGSLRGHAVTVESSPYPIKISENEFSDCYSSIFVRSNNFNQLIVAENKFSDDINNPIVPNNAIGILNCSNGKIQVSENEMLTDYPRGIYFFNVNEFDLLEVNNNQNIFGIYFNSVNPTAGEYAFVIGNKVNSDIEAFGLWNSSYITFEDNEIMANGLLSNGFNIHNSNFNHFRHNEIYLNTYGRGFRSVTSSNNLYCCNIVNDGAIGFSFTGQSNPSTLTTNSVTLDDNTSTSGEVLRLSDAQIGVHDNQGNEWYGVWNVARIFAMDDDDIIFIANNSIFRSRHSTLGQKPEFIGPSSIEDLWWVNVNADPPTCSSMPDCGIDEFEVDSTNPPNPDCSDFTHQISSLNSGVLNGKYEIENKWMLYYTVYSYFDNLDYSSWAGCSDIVSFMDTIDVEIEILRNIENAIQEVNKLTEAQKTALDNASINILNAKTSLKQIYATIHTEIDYINELTNITHYLNQIENASIEANQISTSLDNNSTYLFNTIIQDIDNASTYYDFQDQLLDVWKIKVKILQSGHSSISQAEIERLTSIANGCVLENGQAVNEARAILIHYFDIDDFISYETACDDSKIRELNNSDNPTIKIYPNPSSGIFSILSEDQERFENSQIKVYSASGNLVLSKQNTSRFDLSSHSDGLYFIIVDFKDGKQFFKKIILSK